MSLRLELSTWRHDGTPKVWPLPEGAGLWVEAAATYPASAVERHRRVMVYIPPELVVPLLRELRQSAAAARARPLGQPPT